MTRTLGAGMTTGIALATAETCDFLLLEFASGTVYLTTASRDIDWNGHTWEAVGGALEPGELSESADPDANGHRLRLSGVDQSILALILAENYRGRKATVWYAHLDQTTGAVVADPIITFDGYMNDGFSVTESRGEFGGGTVDIQTRLTARINELTKIRGVRTNVTSHQRTIAAAAAAGDTFFQNVATLPGQRVYWGSQTPAGPWLDPTPTGDPRTNGSIGGGNGPGFGGSGGGTTFMPNIDSGRLG